MYPKVPTVVAAITICLATFQASAATFDAVYVFGDSTVDTGWFRYQPLPTNPTLNALAAASLADGGRIPDTPFGPGAPQVLAAYYGLTANPADNGAGGTNYAASGAQNNANFISPFAPSTVSQINTYLAAHSMSADPSSLYLFSSGGNDIKYASTLTGSARQAWVTTAASDAANALLKLQNAGAKTIIVSNGYVAGTGAPSTLFTTYYSALFSDLASMSVNVRIADVRGLQASIFADPGANGFTSISNADVPGGTALINPDPSLISNSWALYGTTALLRSSPQTTFWADDEHWAAGAQALEGDLFIQVANAPLPAALPLFAGGLAGLGLLGWRRKRKAIAA